MTEDELVAAVQSAIDKGAGTLKAVLELLTDEQGSDAGLGFSKVKRAYTAARAQQPQLTTEQKAERRQQKEQERQQRRVQSGRAGQDAARHRRDRMLTALFDSGRRYANIDIKQLHNELAGIDAELVQHAEDVYLYALQLACHSVVVNNEETEDWSRAALDAAATLGMYAHTYEAEWQGEAQQPDLAENLASESGMPVEAARRIISHCTSRWELRMEAIRAWRAGEREHPWADQWDRPRDVMAMVFRLDPEREWLVCVPCQAAYDMDGCFCSSCRPCPRAIAADLPPPMIWQLPREGRLTFQMHASEADAWKVLRGFPVWK